MSRHNAISDRDLRPLMGPQLRALRANANRSLAEVAGLTGVSEATMSRIETGRSDVSAPHLFRLATLFGVDVGSFFDGGPAPAMKGVRSVSRKGDGHAFDTARMQTRLLCTDLGAKQMHPFLNRVTATDPDAVGGLAAHDGEEYLYVTEGALMLHSEDRAPLLLEAGDSIYFDATTPHAYVAADGTGASFLVVCSSRQ